MKDILSVWADAEIALLQWDLLKAKPEAGIPIAANLRGTLQNRSASRVAIASLTEDLLWRIEKAKEQKP